jgi:hypothetical protein
MHWVVKHLYAGSDESDDEKAVRRKSDRPKKCPKHF